MACTETSNSMNEAELAEEGDPRIITCLLNEKLFEIGGKIPVYYFSGGYYFAE